MMKEENITLEKGSGKENRITKADVIEAKQETSPLEKKATNDFSKKAEETVLAHENLSERKLEADFSQVHRADRKIENRKISFIRRKIAEKLLSVTQNTAMLTTFNELNMGAIQKVRAEYKNSFQKAYDIKLGFLSFFIKASCLALKEFPEVNSQLDFIKNDKKPRFYHRMIFVKKKNWKLCLYHIGFCNSIFFTTTFFQSNIFFFHHLCSCWRCKVLSCLRDCGFCYWFAGFFCWNFFIRSFFVQRIIL